MDERPVAFGDALRAARPSRAEGLARRLGVELVRARVMGGEAPRVGRYEILARLGEGGMGVLFRARDPMLQRDVAIKVLRADAGPEQQERIQHEARALARVNHPNVLAVHDMGIRDGQLWVAMEYVRGTDLRQWVGTQEPLGWPDVVQCFVEAGRGLHAAHEAGVAHRDFKPDNVMLGDDGRVRVADFGLAVLDMPQDLPEPSESPRTWLEGTPSYLPPEALRGAPPGPAGDQYSFCIALRELLDAATDRHATPASLSTLIARGTSPDPGQRWPSMGVVVRQLQDLLHPPLPSKPLQSIARPDLGALLELATQASSREEFRAAALSWLDQAVGFDTALLGRPEAPGSAGPLLQGFEAAFLQRFQEGAQRYAPTLARLIGASLSTHAPVRDVDVFDGSVRAKTPFYNEIIGPKGSKVMVTGALSLGGRPVGALQLSRTARGTTFSDRELELVRDALKIIALAEARFAGPEPEPPASSLPPISKTILQLLDLGLSPGDIAYTCNLSISQVRKLIDDAMRRAAREHQQPGTGPPKTKNQ